MSYTPQEQLSITSLVGINSDTVISGGNWVGNTYTGAGELNNYAYVGVNLQVDEAGTLYFDLSQDGTNWSTYPENGFSVVSGINEVHTAWKGGRYMRPRFVGAGGRTYFRLQTYYSNLALPLSTPLNQNIADDLDATVVRSVSVGQDPTGTYINQKIDGVAFKTTANLNAGVTYDSGVIDTSNFNQVQTQIVSDKDGTLEFIFGNTSTMTGSTVGVGGVDRVVVLPYEAVKGFESFSAPAFTDYVRYRFTNDAASATTHFFFDTKLLTKALSGQVLSSDAPISPSMVANLGRNIIVGQDATGNFRNVPTDTEGNLYVHVQNPTSAFGDLRTIELTPQAQITFPYNINTDIVNVTETNGGTITQGDSMAVLQTSTNTLGEAKLDSRQILKYRAGLGGLARFTGLFTTGVANSEQIIGVGDDEDGFFFGYKDADFGIIVRRNMIDDFIPQTAWNIDDMDGNDGTSNPSNVLLDPTKINVFEIEFQWLGAGQIDFHVEDPNTGHFVPVHRVKYANNNIIPSIYNPSLPLHMHILNDGNNSNLTMKSASMAAFCEGKSIVRGPKRTFGNLKSISTEEALFSIKNKATYVSKTNRISSFIKELTVGNDINQLAVIRIYRNTTLGGTPAFTDINTNNSSMQSDIAGTTVTGGEILFEATVGKDSGSDYKFEVPELDVRPGDTITVTAESNGTGNVRASILWIEDI